MARVPFPPGLAGSKNQPRTRRDLTNLFRNSDGVIIPRPGLTELQSTSLLARGQFQFNQNLYQIFGNNLNRITDTITGAFTTIGTIAGDALVEVDSSFTEAVIVVKAAAGRIYTLDTSEVLTDIRGNTNFVSCRSVAFINGRFVYIPFDGDPAFFSDVGAAGTVQALSFFDAEAQTDLNTVAFNLKETLYIGGTDTFELFRDTGATPNPFTRITGARINVGYIGGLMEHTDTFIFVGREKGQVAGIYTISQGAAPKISNERVDNILAESSTTELEETTSARFKTQGYDVGVFTCGEFSFGFHNGEWFNMTSLLNQEPRKWRGGFVEEFEGEYFTATDDKIGKISTLNTDYGEPIERIIDGAFEQENDDWFTGQRVRLGISQGFNDVAHTDTIPTVGLALSADNIEYGPLLFREIGILGDYEKILEWNPYGGLGRYPGFLGYRIYTTQDVIFAADHLVMDLQ